MFSQNLKHKLLALPIVVLTEVHAAFLAQGEKEALFPEYYGSLVGSVITLVFVFTIDTSVQTQQGAEPLTSVPLPAET